MIVLGDDVRRSDKAEITQPEHFYIGNHVSIDMGVYISVRADIGDYVHIAPHVCIIGGKDSFIYMGDFTNISAGGKIIVASDDFNNGMLNPIVPLEYRHLIGGETRMERFSCVGTNSVVLPNVNMAEGSILGANSLLTKSTIPWGIYVGSPAKLIKMREKKLVLNAYKELGYEY